MRPGGWDVLDLDRDPTPGDVPGVQVLARSAERMALDADRLVRDLRGVAGDGPLLEWLGASGDAVRASLEEFPEHVGTLRDSYDLAGEALRSWATRLDGLQDQADRALEQGRDARADLDRLEAALASARSAAASSARSADDVRADPGTVDAPGPDPVQLRRAVAAARADRERVASLDRQADAAQGRLDAAKRLARQARELREDAGRETGRRLRDAADAGIPPNSTWEDIKGAAGKLWEATVKVATVVAIVVAVVALVVGGPIVWAILAAASAILLVDSIARYARGDGSLWEIGLSLLGIVPGGRLLTALGKMAGLTRVGARAVSATTRGVAAGRAAVTRMTTALRSGATTLLRRGLSAGFDSRLGARFLPRSGHLGDLLRGYDRYGGRTRQQFLDEFFPGGTPRWPADDGFAAPRQPRELQPGERLDRFGEPGGRYLSPDGTPFPERAIPPTNLDPLAPHLGLHRYEVVRPFTVYEGPIAPAFGQPGGGVQQFVDGRLLGLDLPPGTRVNVQWLLDNGYLAVRR